MSAPRDSQRSAEWRPVDGETVVIRDVTIRQVLRNVTRRAGDRLTVPRPRPRRSFVNTW